MAGSPSAAERAASCRPPGATVGTPGTSSASFDRVDDKALLTGSESCSRPPQMERVVDQWRIGCHDVGVAALLDEAELLDEVFEIAVDHLGPPLPRVAGSEEVRGLAFAVSELRSARSVAGGSWHPMTTTDTNSPGRSLREARLQVGLSRAKLAGLADCSIASLANIEQGAAPRRSAVLERAWAVLEAIGELEGSRAPGDIAPPGAAQRSR